MPMKVTMQFVLGRSSWTESHYSRTFTDIYSNGAQAAALKLAGIRSALLGNGAALGRLRLSRTDVKRTINNVPLDGVVPATGSLPQDDPATDADIPNVSAILSCSDQNGHTKNLYLAGIPEGTVEISQATPLYFKFTGGWTKIYNAYVTELVANWNFRVKAPIQPATLVHVVQPTQTPLPGVKITILSPLTGQPADPPFEVDLVGFRRLNTRSPGLSGPYDVIQVDSLVGPPAATVLYLADTGNVSPTNFTRLGTAAVMAFQYVPYQNIVVTKSGTRKRGGSIGAPRGRSRTRA